jgi:DNA-binding response OmpR family regulator
MSETLLRDRISELEEENRQLRQALCPSDNPFVGKVKLSPQQTAVLYALYRAKIASYGYLDKVMSEASSYDRSTEGGAIQLRLKVTVSKMRQSLKGLDIHIHTSWGLGYYLDPISKKKLGDLIK